MEETMKASVAILALTLTLSIGRALAGTDDDVKVVFDRFVVAQNAHNVSAVRDLLWDSPDFLWITRGAPIWGRDAALKRFEALYQGTQTLVKTAGGWRIASILPIPLPTPTPAKSNHC
jgi:hypothetical protein